MLISRPFDADSGDNKGDVLVLQVHYLQVVLV